MQQAILAKGRSFLARNGHLPYVELPLSFSSSLGGKAEMNCIHGAACVIFHAFADITDEAQDHELPEEPWGPWGWEQAVNTGLSLLFSSMGYLEQHLAAPLASEAMPVLLRAGQEMTWGQHVDLLKTLEHADPLSRYLETVSRKTGASVGAYAELAAVLAGRDRAMRGRCQELGRSLGMLFQMISDLDELCFVFPSADYVNGRLSFPMALGLAQLEDLDRAQLEAFRNQPQLFEQASLVSFLEAKGIKSYALFRIEAQRRHVRTMITETFDVPDPYLLRIVETTVSRGCSPI